MVFPFNSSSSLFSTHGSHKPLLVILTILHLFSTNHPSPSTNYSYPSRRFLPIYLTAISPFPSVAIHCSLENTLHRHRFLLFCVRVSATHTTSEYTPPPSTHHLRVHTTSEYTPPPSTHHLRVHTTSAFCLFFCCCCQSVNDHGSSRLLRLQSLEKLLVSLVSTGLGTR